MTNRQSYDTSFYTEWLPLNYSVNWLNFYNEKLLVYRRMVSRNAYLETVCPFHVYVQVCAWIVQSVIQDNLSAQHRSKVAKPYRVPEMIFPHGVDAHTARWCSFVCSGRIPESPFECSHSSEFMVENHTEADLSETNFPFSKNYTLAKDELAQIVDAQQELTQLKSLIITETLLDMDWLKAKAAYDAFLVRRSVYDRALAQLTDRINDPQQAAMLLASFLPVPVEDPGNPVLDNEASSKLIQSVLSAPSIVNIGKTALVGSGDLGKVGEKLSYDDSFVQLYNRFVEFYLKTGLVDYKTLKGTKQCRSRAMLFQSVYSETTALRLKVFMPTKIDVRDVETVLLHDPYVISVGSFPCYHSMKPVFGFTAMRDAMLGTFAESQGSTREVGSKMRNRRTMKEVLAGDDPDEPPDRRRHIPPAAPDPMEVSALSLDDSSAPVSTPAPTTTSFTTPQVSGSVTSGTKRLRVNTPPPGTQPLTNYVSSPTVSRSRAAKPRAKIGAKAKIEAKPSRQPTDYDHS